MKKIKIVLSFVCLMIILCIGKVSPVSAISVNNDVKTIDKFHVFKVAFYTDITDDYFKIGSLDYNRNDEIYKHLYIIDSNGNKITDFYPIKINDRLVEAIMYKPLPENEIVSFYVDGFKAKDSTITMKSTINKFYISKYSQLEVYKLINNEFVKIDAKNIICDQKTIIINENIDGSKYYIRMPNNEYKLLEKIESNINSTVFKVSE